MSKLTVPTGYASPLSVYETQIAIGSLRRCFEDRLGAALNLRRVSAPLIVDPSTGLNDDLNGVERPVQFDILETKTDAQVVHPWPSGSGWRCISTTSPWERGCTPI